MSPQLSHRHSNSTAFISENLGGYPGVPRIDGRRARAISTNSRPRTTVQHFVQRSLQHISRRFCNLRTVQQKHPGGGVPCTPCTGPTTSSSTGFQLVCSFVAAAVRDGAFRFPVSEHRISVRALIPRAAYHSRAFRKGWASSFSLPCSEPFVFKRAPALAQCRPAITQNSLPPPSGLS